MRDSIQYITYIAILGSNGMEIDGPLIEKSMGETVRVSMVAVSL